MPIVPCVALIVPLLSLGLFPAQAGDAARAEARAVVRGIEERYEKVKTLQATFLERYSEGRHSVRAESGTVYFSRPGRMRWEYESPEEKLFLVDGTNAWFYVPADRTATRAKVKESADWHTPLALLAGKTGRGALGRLCGRTELIPTANSVYRVRCSPKSPDMSFHELLIDADAQYRLVSVVIREKGGTETEFRFAAWRENPPLAEVLFHFSAPKGVAIVEESSIAGPAR